MLGCIDVYILSGEDVVGADHVTMDYQRTSGSSLFEEMR